MSDRLARQLEFVLEIDRLKRVLRRTLLTDRSRRENSAEHSWHLAVMAVLLAEHATARIDVHKVVKMVLVHDLVEIDAGDTFLYDTAARASQAAAERRAAERLFGLLPTDQAAELEALWQEFEERSSAEARFAYALDRLQPVLQNVATQGVAWREHGVRAEQVLAANQPVADGAPDLWQHVRRLIEEAVAKGFLAE